MNKQIQAEAQRWLARVLALVGVACCTYAALSINHIAGFIFAGVALIAIAVLIDGGWA